LEKLEKLLSDLEQIANQKGNTIRKLNDKRRNASLISNKVSDQNTSDLNQISISLLRLIGDEITDERGGILEIPKSLIENNNSQKRLQKAIDSIFVLSRTQLIKKYI